MSLVNQALQKVRAQQAMQHAVNAPMPSYIAAPRRASVGFLPVVLAILLAGGLLGGWWGFGAFRANREQTVSLPEPAPAKIAIAAPPAAPPASVTENLKPLDTPKPYDTTTAAADFRQITAEARQPAAETKPTPSLVPAAPALPPSMDHVVAQVFPLVTQPPLSTIDAATPTILKTPDVAGMTEIQPAPIAPPPATSEAIVPKEPVLLNAQTLDVPGSSKIKLTAVLRSFDGWNAVINDTIVAEGDEVESATVVSIGDKRVKLKIEQKTYTLKLP